MTRRLLWGPLLCALCACRPAAGRVQGDDSGTATGKALAAARPDTSIIEVAGPTLVVFFPGAYAVADSGGDAAELLGDLQYHLGSARPAIDSLGVTIVERYGGAIDFVLDGTAQRLVPARDSARIGYVFLRPGTRAHVHYGLLTDIELIDTARARLVQAARP